MPSRAVSDTPRQRAHSAITRNAPIERTVAWTNGGISGSASFTETWLRPHESVSAIMISAATASSGREVLLEFTEGISSARRVRAARRDFQRFVMMAAMPCRNAHKRR